jgi:UDPglucose 6-dehydrogenase
MKIAMVGSGYVGLVSGACFADFGHDVVCIDKDQSKIDRLHQGIMPIYEPGLDALVESNVKAGRLKFTTDLAEGIKGAAAIFIAVGTPSRRGDGHADLTFVYEVAREVGESLSNEAVIVTKSTVPVGTGDEVERIIGETGTKHRFAVVSNPEFLREGAAIGDFKRPDRIVIGAEDDFGREVMREVYRPLFLNESPILFTSRRSSELIKYAANAFLATKISFINEISNVCELVGADVSEVAYGIGLDERIGPRFLRAGIGWGGSCFPKDVAALSSIAREYDYEPLLLDAAVAVNERQQKAVIGKLQRDLHTLKGKRIALLGLAFKANTDDLREAPSLKIADTLHSMGAKVVGYDPVAGKAAAKEATSLRVVFDPYEALEGAQAVVVVTDWEEFRQLDLERAASLMERPSLLIDGRNALDAREVRAAGLLYRGFGRG